MIDHVVATNDKLTGAVLFLDTCIEYIYLDILNLLIICHVDAFLKHFS